LILGDAAAAGAGVAAAVTGAAAGGDFSVTACCFLHMEKFSASSNGRIANRIIIEVLRD